MLLSTRPAWAEINLDHLSHNFSQLKSALTPGTGILAVVKADGYGHGAVETAKIAVESGASFLAVAFAAEAVELRKAGIEIPILIFGYTDPQQVKLAAENNFRLTVFDHDSLISLSKASAEAGASIPVHLKVDTGMGRLGFKPEDVPGAALEINSLQGLRLEGIYTHFAAADEKDLSFTRSQVSLFNRVIEKCEDLNISFPYIHASNSAAVLSCPGAHYSLARPGIMLYGYNPLPAADSGEVSLKPVLAFKSRIVQVKRFAAGSPISYGCTYHTPADALIAVVSAGYADGYNRLLSNRAEVIIRGRRVPVVGRVCMDYFMVDTTALPAARRGDEVTLIGECAGERIDADELAGICSTISYEILCAIGRRVPRLYFRHGRLVGVDDPLQKEFLRFS